MPAELQEKPKWDPIAYLEGLRTRQLLSLLDCCRRCNDCYDVLDNNSDRYVRSAQVKQVLGTREHIPNKAEAKALRQERARKK